MIPVQWYSDTGASELSTAEPTTCCFPLHLKGRDAHVVLDFKQNVGGFTTVSFGTTSDDEQIVGLAFSESSLYAACPSDAVGACADGDGQAGAGDHSNGGHGPDGTLETGHITANTTFTPKVERMRGGFRYLNLFLKTNGSVVINNVSVHFTAAPTMKNPRAYANHFYSSDDLVNKIWYGCAYTVQMCTLDPMHGRQWPPPIHGWNNGVKIGVGDSILVDGAKRDRTIWPGDMGISSATAFATVGDVDSSKQSLDTLYEHQNPHTGQIPYVGPAVFCRKPEGVGCDGQGSWRSDTYHLWALIGTANVFRYSTPGVAKAWMRTGGVGHSGIWPKYQKAIESSLRKIGPRGLMVVNCTADWQRSGMGGENIAANALLAHVLENAASIAEALGHPEGAAIYSANKSALVQAINSVLWDEEVGAYKDNPDSELHPQDGNSLMVWFNVTLPERKARILSHLQRNWSPLGSVSPEWTYQGHKAIGTFPGSMEVLARMSAGDTANALSLIKRQWGYMLNTNISTQSTFWEGFQASGEFAFQGIYMSHAHGWATGPASALTFYTLGVRPHTPGGQEYIVAPQPIGLDWCNGSLTFGSGVVQVAWLLEGKSESGSESGYNDGNQPFFSAFHLVVDVSMHTEATAGHIGLPLSALNISRPQDATITFNEDGALHPHIQGVLDLSYASTQGVSHLNTQRASQVNTQGVLDMGDGVDRSSWGWRDGRLWFVVSRPGRFSMHLRPVHR